MSAHLTAQQANDLTLSSFRERCVQARADGQKEFDDDCRRRDEMIKAQPCGEVPSEPAREILQHIPSWIRDARRRGKKRVGLMEVKRLNPLDDLSTEVFNFCWRAGLAPTIEHDGSPRGSNYFIYLPLD
jgi:hypothetical protein